MVLIHFTKRELETIFVHRFSTDTMPFTYIFRNSAHYHILAGLIFGYIVYHPIYSTSIRTTPQTLITLVLFTYFELSNLKTHLTLRALRPEGSRVRGIPRGYGFDWPFGGITCPHYFFEIMAWVVVACWTWCWGILPFLAVAIFIMDRWASQVRFFFHLK
jgi:very-long-chain enoyl-CoA reductase